MMTFDAFLGTDELVALMTGLSMDRAPVLIDRTSGNSACCSPTRIDGFPGMIASIAMVPSRQTRRGDNAWWCTLPIAEDVLEVPLSLVIGDVVRNATVRRRPEPAVSVPEPAPTPKRARRARAKRS